MTRLAICALMGALAISGAQAQSAKRSLAKAPPPSAGLLADGVYRNSFFGFSCKVRYGWVERSEQLRDTSKDPSDAQVLLAVFERPPEVKGEGVNPAVIIAAESLTSYPDVKTASDYLDPLTQAATSQGFAAVNDPYETTVGGKAVVGRDFSKEAGKVTIYQSSLVVLSKGYAVSFTFIGESEDEVEQLIGGLSFGPPLPGGHLGGSDKTKSKPH